MSSIKKTALIIGASGGIGAACVRQLETAPTFSDTVGLSRSNNTDFDITDEQSVNIYADRLKNQGHSFDLIICATGFLHGKNKQPEKRLQQVEASHLLHSFMVNSIGPALAIKHFSPLLKRRSRSVFALLSARVGSIADNRLGGWYAYRASKAALNQLVKTAANELERTIPNAVLVALHPGTVETALSAPFAKDGLAVAAPDQAAAEILSTLSLLKPAQSGCFLDRHGQPIPW